MGGECSSITLRINLAIGSSGGLALRQTIISEAEETRRKALWALDQVEDRMVLDPQGGIPS
jgi:hypothetical protein